MVVDGFEVFLMGFEWYFHGFDLFLHVFPVVFSGFKSWAFLRFPKKGLELGFFVFSIL